MNSNACRPAKLNRSPSRTLPSLRRSAARRRYNRIVAHVLRVGLVMLGTLAVIAVSNVGYHSLYPSGRESMFCALHPAECEKFYGVRPDCILRTRNPLELSSQWKLSQLLSAGW